MTTLYEIRNADTGWKLMKPGTERDVRRFWKEKQPTEVRNQKIDGVIVIFVRFAGGVACGAVMFVPALAAVLIKSGAL